MRPPPKKKIDVSQATRFWSKVDRSGGPDACWPWLAATRSGYGNFWFNGALLIASRVAWFLAKGKIPAGKWVLHKCDFSLCVNPSHLFLGTRQDNVDDMVAKNRHSKGEAVYTAKLSANAILELRAKYKTGKYTFAALAKTYSVARSTVWFAVRGSAWKHVDD